VRFIKSVLLVTSILFFSLAHGALAQTKGKESVILVWGDSLSAAYGIEVSQGWVSLLQDRLLVEQKPYRVVNGSVSGETTVGGRARLPQALAEHQPEIILIGLGANDGLRGFNPQVISQHLSEMIELSIASKTKVLLFEMKIPPNYGPRYTQAFEAVFTEVSQKHSVALLPFWLEPIALEPKWMQADGLHPTALAQPVLLEQVWEGLLPLLGH